MMCGAHITPKRVATRRSADATDVYSRLSGTAVRRFLIAPSAHILLPGHCLCSSQARCNHESLAASSSSSSCCAATDIGWMIGVDSGPRWVEPAETARECRSFHFGTGGVVGGGDGGGDGDGGGGCLLCE